MPIRRHALLALLLLAAPALGQAPAPAAFAGLGLPAALTKARLQGLLQEFVDAEYGKGFRHLGDERDFDHGHLLFDAAGRPVAILYHTQELALENAGDAQFGWIDPEGRNWIQWLDGGKVENAERFRRAAYPRSATWDWFRARDLPKLEEHRTILDKMLDPRRIAVDPAKSVQYVFTREDCAGASADAASRDIRVVLPTRENVCLALARD